MQQAARASDSPRSSTSRGAAARHLVEIDETEKIFSNPAQKETEDYVTGRFG